MALISNAMPKARFAESGDNLRKHRDLVDSKEFQRGTDFAILEYATHLASSVSDANSALRAGFALAGAIDYVLTLKTLADVPKPLAQAPSNGIDYKAS